MPVVIFFTCLDLEQKSSFLDGYLLKKSCLNFAQAESFHMQDSGHNISIPDISRVRGVHLQGIQGCSRSRLLQALDNAANGRLELARRVKIFEKLYKKIFGTNCHIKTRSKIVNNKLFSLLINRPFENFHEIFGLMVIARILGS